jgi:hypothetical protein
VLVNHAIAFKDILDLFIDLLSTSFAPDHRVILACSRRRGFSII